MRECSSNMKELDERSASMAPCIADMLQGRDRRGGEGVKGQEREGSKGRWESRRRLEVRAEPSQGSCRNVDRSR